MIDGAARRPAVVVVADDLDDAVRASLITLLGDLAELRSAAGVPTGPDIVGVVVGPETPLDAQAVASLPDLRVVSASCVGTDHLALDAIVAAGAHVTRVADYCTDEVADHALALVLALLRRLGPGDQAVRAGRWNIPEPGPRRIAGTRLGLVGFGRTARALAMRASGLGMVIGAYSRDPHTVVASGVRPYAQLNDLLADSDVVSLHVPLTQSTRHVINEAALASMPPGALLVNVARGGLIDDGPLAAALERGHLSGAALDVLDCEPPGSAHPLTGRSDVLLTPHIAWDSPAARQEVLLHAVRDVAAVLRGDLPAGLVCAPTMYEEAR